MKIFQKSIRKTTSKINQDKQNIAAVLDTLTADSEQILDSKLAQKIAELHQICQQDCWKLDRIPEIRQEAEADIDNYFKEVEEAGEDDAAGNPLMQLLTGGLAGGHDEKDEKAKESKSSTKISSKAASKLLLNQIKLSEDNKINLKLCLELEKKESKSKIAEEGENVNIAELTPLENEEPPAKKAKNEEEGTATSTSKDKTDETEQGTENEKEDKKDPIFPSNKSIKELTQIIRPHIDEIVDWCATLRAWMLLSMKRNQNLGGADLQGECQAVIIEEIKGLEDEFNAYKEALTAYHLTKATILEKYIKGFFEVS